MRRRGLGRLLRHTVTIEPYLGEGPYGPAYGTAATVRAFVQAEQRQVLDDHGAQLISNTVVYMRLDVVCPARSRLTLPGGVIARVLVSAPHHSGGLSSLDHLEVHCA